MSRFVLRPKFSNLVAIGRNDPGDLRSRNAVKPRSSSKRLQAFYDAQYGPNDISVSSAQTAMVETTAKASAAVPVVPSKPTAAELVAKAKADARAKVASVTAASAYKGREATARKLLLDGKQSAAEIVKTLAASPTDAQLAAVDRHLKAKAADAVWARAYGLTTTPNASVVKPESTTGSSKYDDVWARAYGVAASNNAKETKPSARTPDQVWENAYKQPQILKGASA